MNEKGQKIIALRKQGKTYSEIETILKLPKSTVGWWLRGVKMDKLVEKKTLERCRKKWRKNILNYNNIYAKIRSEEAANIREKIAQKASEEIGEIAEYNLRLIGSALYWAEGNTKSRHMLRFANSNPDIIKVIMKFFQKICGIPDEKIKARVHLHPNISQKESEKYWSKITGLSRDHFQKPQVQISRASKGKRKKNTLPYGTLHLTICNTAKACTVKGWIRGISEKISN